MSQSLTVIKIKWNIKQFNSHKLLVVPVTFLRFSKIVIKKLINLNVP